MKDAPIAQSNYSKVQTGICKSPKIMCCNGRRYHLVKPYVYYWCGDSLNPFGHCWFRQREGPEINWRPLGVTRHYLRMLYSIACVSYCGTDGITLFFQSCFLCLSLSLSVDSMLLTLFLLFSPLRESLDALSLGLLFSCDRMNWLRCGSAVTSLSIVSRVIGILEQPSWLRPSSMTQLCRALAVPPERHIWNREAMPDFQTTAVNNSSYAVADVPMGA